MQTPNIFNFQWYDKYKRSICRNNSALVINLLLATINVGQFITSRLIMFLPPEHYQILFILKLSDFNSFCAACRNWKKGSKCVFSLIWGSRHHYTFCPYVSSVFLTLPPYVRHSICVFFLHTKWDLFCREMMRNLKKKNHKTSFHVFCCSHDPSHSVASLWLQWATHQAQFCLNLIRIQSPVTAGFSTKSNLRVSK